MTPTLSIIYQHRAIRAIRDCLVIPTHFVEVLGRHKEIARPGFAVTGTLYGKDRTFHIVEDQLFLLKPNGKTYRLGEVLPKTLALLETVREQVARLRLRSNEELNRAADAKIEDILRQKGFRIPGEQEGGFEEHER